MIYLWIYLGGVVLTLFLSGFILKEGEWNDPDETLPLVGMSFLWPLFLLFCVGAIAIHSPMWLGSGLSYLWKKWRCKCKHQS
jgi:hypothetical protein